MIWEIPFNRPFVAGNELKYVTESIERGHVSGDGHFTKLCERLLQDRISSPRVMLTTSCTHALELSALLMDFEPGDEVIVPSFTFPSTANAFLLHGARPVFVDIRPDTLNIDEKQIEERITPRTRAIVPVHYGGVACEMNEILAIAKRHGLRVIEDNAQGLFGSYEGKPLGSFGDLACQSFHETKNCSCGEGGALAIRDEQLIERAEILREKGTNRARFFRGEVDKYSWVDVGSSFLPSDLLAAFLYGQLEEHNSIQYTRRRIWNRYHEQLADWSLENGVRLPHVPANCESSHHLYALIMPTEADRDGLIAQLRSEGILAVFHYQPLHASEMGEKLGGRAGDCPVTEDMSRRLVRLPFFNDLSEADQSRVVDVVQSYHVAI